MNEKIKIDQVNTGELISAEYNPRKWDEKAVKQLSESIKRFGLVDPIIVNCAPQRKNIVIGGHFRLHVAKLSGLTEVPVVFISIPEVEKEMELNVRLNKNAGQWDFDLLANFNDSILSDSGFEKQELDRIFNLSPQGDEEKNCKRCKDLKEQVAGHQKKEGHIFSAKEE